MLPRVAAAALLLLAVGLAPAQTPARAPIRIDGLGKGMVALHGPWRFHLGDNSAWAAPGFDDSHWQKITADQPWGSQGHDRYTGYAWYRCHLALTPAPGIAPQFALLIRRVDDAYEVYWNGVLVGRNGRVDPIRLWYFAQSPQMFSLGAARSGVLAVRVWKAPLFSDDRGQWGGFEGAPLIGSPVAIATARAAIQYRWLRNRQFLFGQNLIYAVIALLSLLLWLRDRNRWLLFWMFVFAGCLPLRLMLLGAHIRWPYVLAIGTMQPIFALQDISLWYLLLWLLPLRQNRRLCRLTNVLAAISLANTTLDGILLAIQWGPRWIATVQVLDGLSAALYTAIHPLPLVLVAIAFSQRRRFDLARWLVAILAALDDMVAVAKNIAEQGRQFTNSTLSARLEAPLFTISGSAISLHTLTGALLLIAIVYAVASRLRAEQRQRDVLEREKVELTRTRDQMRHFAEHDDLTGLWNHRIITERLRAEVERSAREGQPLSVILADIDHFKDINDTFGHLAGDVVLREIASIFLRSVRVYDSVGRYGGEEFLIVLPGSGFENARHRAEELRKAIEAAQIVDGDNPVPVTSSFGVASGFPSEDDVEAAIRAADTALYRAKENGRNCVVAVDLSMESQSAGVAPAD